MLIDWFTVVAQVINLLILVWLLRRFLYGPITRAMATRQQGIDDELAEAARLRAEAAAESERLRGETTRLAAEREDRSRQLREELDDDRRAQLALARTEVDELHARWREAVVRERDGFLLELRQRAGQQIVEVVRQALRDLADQPLEGQVLVRFLDRLRALDDAERRVLISAASTDGGQVHLRTAFDVPAPMRDQLAAAVRDTLGEGLELRFEVHPTLLGGVELRAGGQALAWTFDEYLETLEDALADALGPGGEEERRATP